MSIICRNNVNNKVVNDRNRLRSKDFSTYRRVRRHRSVLSIIFVTVFSLLVTVHSLSRHTVIVGAFSSSSSSSLASSRLRHSQRSSTFYHSRPDHTAFLWTRRFAFAKNPSLDSDSASTSTSGTKMAASSTSSSAGDSGASFEKPEHVIIAGAGVIGTCTAYYLAKNHGVKRITIIDPTGTIAPAASGKAGGFLAKDWNDGSPTQQLTHRSFELHQQIADTIGADRIQYRRLECASISVNRGKGNHKPSGKKLQGMEWVTGDSDVFRARLLGTESTIAQVHPKMLCENLWEETQKLAPDSQLIKGRVVQTVVGKDNDNGKIGARYVEEEDDATTVILYGDSMLYACGPWTANVMEGVKYHSAIIPTDNLLKQCVFFSGCGDPEVYVRPDKTAYCTGFPDDPIFVTERPGQEEVRRDAIDTILKSVREASGSSDGSTSTSTTGSENGMVGALSKDPVLEQACYLPSTYDGVPAMGVLEDVGNGRCYISTGHTCWGILLGPASGEAMASLIATGKSTPEVDLRWFNPSRLGDIQLVP